MEQISRYNIYKGSDDEYVAINNVDRRTRGERIADKTPGGLASKILDSNPDKKFLLSWGQVGERDLDFEEKTRFNRYLNERGIFSKTRKG